MKSLMLLLALIPLSMQSPASEQGFVPLFNGKDFTGWKISNPASFKIENGAIVANGTAGHAYYDGPVGKTFRNFELKIDVMTKPNSNGGVYVMTEFQEKGFPSKGFEIQVNNTYKDPVKSGSLYHVQDIMEAPAKDDEWFTEHIIAQGETITVRVNDKQVVQWTQPGDWNGGREGPGRRLGSGTIALQAHDPGSTVYYKNIRIKPLDSAQSQGAATAQAHTPAPAAGQGRGNQPAQPMTFFVTQRRPRQGCEPRRAGGCRRALSGARHRRRGRRPSVARLPEHAGTERGQRPRPHRQGTLAQRERCIGRPRSRTPARRHD